MSNTRVINYGYVYFEKIIGNKEASELNEKLDKLNSTEGIYDDVLSASIQKVKDNLLEIEFDIYGRNIEDTQDTILNMLFSFGAVSLCLGEFQAFDSTGDGYYMGIGYIENAQAFERLLGDGFEDKIDEYYKDLIEFYNDEDDI